MSEKQAADPGAIEGEFRETKPGEDTRGKVYDANQFNKTFGSKADELAAHAARLLYAEDQVTRPEKVETHIPTGRTIIDAEFEPIRPPANNPPSPEAARFQPPTFDEIVERVTQNQRNKLATDVGLTPEQSAQMSAAAVAETIGLATESDSQIARGAARQLSSMVKEAYSGLTTEELAAVQKQVSDQLVILAHNQAKKEQALDDLEAKLSGQVRVGQPQVPTQEALQQTEPVLLNRLAKEAEKRAANILAKEPHLSPEEAYARGVNIVTSRLMQNTSSAEKIAQAAKAMAETDPSAADVGALAKQFEAEMQEFAARQGGDKDKLGNLRLSLLPEQQSASAAPEPTAVPPQPDPTIHATAKVPPPQSQMPGPEAQQRPPTMTWEEAVRVLKFDEHDIQTILDVHENLSPDEWNQAVETLVNGKYNKLAKELKFDETFDPSLTEAFIKQEYREALQNLVAQRGEIPVDIDDLREQLTDLQETGEFGALNDGELKIKVISKFKDLSAMLRNAPIGLVVKAKLAYQATLGSIKNERLRKVVGASAVIVGTAVVALVARHMLDSDIDTDASASAPNVGESPATPEDIGKGTEAHPKPPGQEQPPPETPGPEDQKGALYVPESDNWWGIAADLLTEARQKGDIDSLDDSKRQAVIEALQAANPEGINKEGIDITPALEAIERLKAEDAAASNLIETSTTIYEARRGDTIEKIASKLFEAYGIDNPSDQLRTDVEQSLIENNYTYNGSQHWIDEGQNIHLEDAKNVINEFLQPQGGDFTEVSNVQETPEVITQGPEPLAEVPAVQAIEGGEAARQRNETNFIQEILGGGVEVTGPTIDARPGENWSVVMRQVGVPAEQSDAVMRLVGPQLKELGFATEVPTFPGKYVVGNKLLPPTVGEILRKAALHLSERLL